MTQRQEAERRVADAGATSIVRLAIPAEEFVLWETLRAVPDVTFACEQAVTSGAVLPLIWAHGADRDELEAAFADDSSVQSATLSAEFEDKWLYQMEWHNSVQVLVRMITNSSATILDAHSRNGEWSLRVLYSDPEERSATTDFYDDHGLTIDVRAVRQVNDHRAGRYELTDGQFEILRLATRRGFFQVPRETTLQDLAEEMSVSHQALSERLRRGIEALVRSTLSVEASPDGGECI